ncbi:MAG: hypothetical protein AAFX94_16720, partial [Myxococcota bacterium]
MRSLLLIVVCAGQLLFTGAVRGQEPPATVGRTDPRLDLDQGWPAGTIREQLSRDSTLIPFGKGAVFVPAMTNPLDEPPVTVYQAGRQIREAKTGERIVLNPGNYAVFVGSGSEEQRLSFATEVREMNT